ncbi:unnamed protein product [Symbiodinium sp. CCMP2592]|nr:unnamed protein product [Symbiodinium sp. CCMP2592]
MERDLPAYREMLRRLAADPVGQTLQFELLMRLFFQHVLNVRPETVDCRRSRPRGAAREWCQDGAAAASTGAGMLGPVLAFRGEIEAQGRGSLHPHILVWLVCRHLQAGSGMGMARRVVARGRGLAYVGGRVGSDVRLPEVLQDLAERLRNHRAHLQECLRTFMHMAVASFESISHASVQAAPRMLGEPCMGSPLPVSEVASSLSKYDGGSDLDLLRELSNRTEEQQAFLDAASGADWQRACVQREVAVSRESIYGTAVNRFAVAQTPKYRCWGLLCDSAKPEEDARQWQAHFLQDLHNLAPALLKHQCSDSCYKYSDKSSVSWKICRHSFYHVVSICDGCKCRRKGKALRPALHVASMVEAAHGMQGRLRPIQLGPFEVQTSYGGLVSGRQNLDVQDLRRVLDPELWLGVGEVLPHVGAIDNLGYMARYEWNGETYEERVALGGAVGGFLRDPSADDVSLWVASAGRAVADCSLWAGAIEDGEKPAADDGPWQLSDDTVFRTSTKAEDLVKAIRCGVSEAFSDGANSGFYINTYTTKANPSLAGMLEELRRGIERLESERAVREQEAAEARRVAAEEGVVLKNGRGKLFRETRKTLSRLSSSYRRCHWKSVAEVVFPLLFEHLTFASHRTWKLYTKKAIYFCVEAWKRRYGPSVLRCEPRPDSEPVVYQREGLDEVVLRGWRKVVREDELTGEETHLYVGPAGQVCRSVEAAFDEDQAAASCCKDAQHKLTFMQALLQQHAVKERVSEDPGAEACDSNLQALQATGEDAAVSACRSYGKNGLVVATSSLEDYLFRGDHPLVRDMSWSTYGMWVYRVELPPTLVGNSVRAALPRHVDVFFAEKYKLSASHCQRISSEPRVPMFEGFTMPTLTMDSERNAMYKQLQCRPFRVLHYEGDDTEGAVLKAFDVFSAPVDATSAEPSIAASMAFTSAFLAWHQEAAEEAVIARRRFAARFEFPSLWETREMRDVLVEKMDAMNVDVSQSLASDPDKDKERVSVGQYSSMLAVERVANLEGLARARQQRPRPKRRRELDMQLQEDFVRVRMEGENAGDAGEVDAEDECPDVVATPIPREQFQLVLQRPQGDDEVRKLLSLDGQSRKTRHTKDFLELSWMQRDLSVVLDKAPAALHSAAQKLGRELAAAYQEMREELLSGIRDGSEVAAGPDTAANASAITYIRELVGDKLPANCVGFDESVRRVFSKPSLLMKAMVDGLPEEQRLNEDQALFISRFADVLDKVFAQEENAEIWPKERKTYHMLLLGQGGSGKTHMVQKLIFPIVLFIWPPRKNRETIQVVAAKKSQAKNISTSEVKAKTLHTASAMRVQKLVNSQMGAGQKIDRLRDLWEECRVLILEEISMVSAAMYNMLDYRSMLGRAAVFGVSSHTYTRISLIDDLKRKDEYGQYVHRDVGVEIQNAQLVFQAVPDVFELRGTKRFRPGDPLIEILQCMRTGRRFSEELCVKLRDRFVKDAGLGQCDPRLDEEGFLDGYCMSIYWSSLTRMMNRRVQVDAHRHGVPLVVLQCADECQGLKGQKMRSFLSQPNPYKTGYAHGVLPCHIGMKLRFLQKVDGDKGLVQDTVGTLVDFEFHPQDRERYAGTDAGHFFVPKYLPSGLWLSLENFDGCSSWHGVRDVCQKGNIAKGAEEAERLARSMYFLPAAQTSVAFSSTESFEVRRCCFQVSHGSFLTSTASQGLTLRRPTIVDCARLPELDEDHCWLHLYIMLSRVTCLEHLLLLRPPSREQFERGPPKAIREVLRTFEEKAARCREGALRLASCGTEQSSERPKQRRRIARFPTR